MTRKDLKIMDIEKKVISDIFDKKIQKSVIKDLTHATNDSGKSRHYTPAAQEWYNSIYSYNSNYNKTLPVADTNLMRLLKSYFNMEINHKILNTKRMATRYKRLTTNKIFVGRGDLKHTSSKAIITVYLYNPIKMSLYKSMDLTKKALFYPLKGLVKSVVKDSKNNTIISYNRPLALSEYLALPEHHDKVYIDYVIPFLDINNKYLSNLEIQRNILIKLVNLKLITEEDKNENLMNIYNNITFFNHINYEAFMKITELNYQKNLMKFRYLFGFNKIKFTQPFISGLIGLVQEIYQKKVEFNIVSLKKMHSNSDIYTQAVALKLKNRDNTLYRVLKASLRKVLLPEIHKISERYYNIDRNELLVNIIRNDSITSMFKINDTKDSLNNLLLNLFPSAWGNTKSERLCNSIEKLSDNSKLSSFKLRNSYEAFHSYIIYSLKHLKLRGVRVEAKGRITRRFTASRSVFKMKWKGGLKNVDSSFKGISTIMLRGYAKSNVQYSFISSKNRNGAYGVKGWVSSK